MIKAKIFLVVLACFLGFCLVFWGCGEPGGNVNNNDNGQNGGNSGDNNEPKNPDGNNDGKTTTYTITFDANGGSGTVPSAQIVNAGSSINLPNEGGLTRTGYNFGGWTNNAAGTGNVYQPGNSYTPSGNITLYAKWNVIQYTVTFEANGGTPAPLQQNINHGGKVTEPAPMTNTGYGFGGWFKNEALTNQWDFDTDTITGDITLYAMWDMNFFTVTFDADGGTPEPAEQDIAHNSKVIEPGGMVKTGYSFFGWFKEEALISEWNFTTDTVTQTITLYAKWLSNTAGITLDVKQITDGAPIINAITISRTGSNSIPVTFPIDVSNSSEYTSITWEISGVGFYADQTVTDSGASFNLDATEIKYNSLGGHVIILIVVKGGMEYKRAIPFTIVQ